jgi:diaminopimelate epimerase
MKLEFFKYQGTGNDFIVMDNRLGLYADLSQHQIASLCERRMGIGADGLMLLQQKDGYDFEMIYYNADGKEGSMCGNGGRCIVQFAFDLKLITDKCLFIATDGPHEAVITNPGMIELKMKDVRAIEKRNEISVLNTGSPHYIQPVDDLDAMDVEKEGKLVRYSPEFKKDGINVNFIQIKNNLLHIRTYERGVEAETLSCGTGATAAALSIARKGTDPQYVEILTRGGLLNVKFTQTKEGNFENIWLCGPAIRVFQGTITI